MNDKEEKEGFQPSNIWEAVFWELVRSRSRHFSGYIDDADVVRAADQADESMRRHKKAMEEMSKNER